LAVRAVQSMSWVVVAAVSALNSAWQGARWQEAGFKQMWLQGVLSWPALRAAMAVALLGFVRVWAGWLVGREESECGVQC